MEGFRIKSKLEYLILHNVSHNTIVIMHDGWPMYDDLEVFVMTTQ